MKEWLLRCLAARCLFVIPGIVLFEVQARLHDSH